MRRVREFEAWSVPGQLLDPEYGKTLDKELWAEGIPEDVFLGVSALPDETDSRNLMMLLAAGEVTEAAFISFCERQNLDADSCSPQSASKFIEYTYGRCLAWIHLPEESDPSLFRKIVALLEARGHIVVEPR